MYRRRQHRSSPPTLSALSLWAQRLLDHALLSRTALLPWSTLPIGLGLGLCWLLGLALGGAAHMAPHWFYLPIIVAALRFGWAGALLTALLATTIAGPLLPADVAHWTPQEPTDWLSRGLFFILLGQAYAWLCARLRAAFTRELARVQQERDRAHQESTRRQTLEARLRESEERFRAAFQQAGTGNLLATLDGTLLEVNGTLCQLLGYGEQELLTMSMRDITHPDDLAASQQIVRRLSRGDIDRTTVEKRYRQRDGHVIWVQATLALLRDDGGAPQYIMNQIQDISAQRQAQEALREADEFTRQVITSAQEGVVVYDRALRYVGWNPYMETLSGRAATEVLGKSALDLFPHLRDHGIDRLLRRALEGETVQVPDIPYTVCPRTGETVWVTGVYAPHYNSHGTIVGVIGIINDVTARRKVEETVRHLATIVEAAHDGIVSLSLDGRITSWNGGATALFGYPAAAAMGHDVALLFPPEHSAAHTLLADVRRGVAPVMVETVCRRQDGALRAIALSLSPMVDADGQVSGAALICHDIEERTRLEAQLRHQAFHDALTGLANRALLHDRLEHALHRATRERTSHALLFLDLDNFKGVNDTLGHAAGDALLRAVAARLRACVRPQDTVARLGGDEFALLLEETDHAGAAQVCARLVAALRAPLTVAERELTVGTSIGIALSATVADADGLLRAADAAMYVAKRSGKGLWAFYEESLHAILADHFELHLELERAIAAETLAVHYQPIMALEGGTIVGVEALARWTHATRGPISPATFIPLAEESELIGALDTLVLRRACAQVAAWQAAGLPALRLAVNLSGRALQEPDLAGRIVQIVRESGLDPAQLELELTETVAVSEDADTLAVLGALREQGIRLALDDFGTGYSILRRLHRLPFTTLKIDRSFIQEMTAPAKAGLVPLVIGLGHSLGLEVVAEGVETVAQARLLREQGCEYAQGYAFSRPVEAEALAALLHQAAVVAEASPSDAVTRPLLAELARLTGLETTYLTRIDWLRQEQEICIAHNSGALVIAEGLRVAWADTLCRRALEGGPRATSEVPRVYPDSAAAEELGLQTYVSVPVRGAGHEVVGTLCGASRTSVEVGAHTVAALERVAAALAEQLTHAA